MTPGRRDADVVVVGGGVAGLVVARDCAADGRAVVVLEAADRLGGCVAGVEVAGLVLDAGAESFATRSPAVPDLLADLGLADDVALPAPHAAWLRLPDRSLPLPRTGVLGIPGDPWAADVRRAIGAAGALRASLDRLMPARVGFGGTSLGALVRRRMGRRVLERLVAPVVTGVHSAHPDDVDLDAVLPGLRAHVLRHGSLAGAAGAIRAAAPAGSAVAGIAGGMHRLPAALAAEVRGRGGEVRTGARVTGLVPRDLRRDDRPRDGRDEVDGADTDVGRWAVELADGTRVTCDDVVVATPGPVALGLLRGLAPVAGLEPAPDAGVLLVTLVLDAPALASAPRGTGVLVARGVPWVRAKALTHATAKWPWLRERAGGREVVRLSYGAAGAAPRTEPGPVPGAGRRGETGTPGHVDVADLAEDALRGLAVRDAAALLGVPIEPDDVVGLARTAWPAGLPHARPGHRARVDAVRAEVEGRPGLRVCGAWLAGTGLAAVVADARRTATAILDGAQK